MSRSRIISTGPPTHHLLKRINTSSPVIVIIPIIASLLLLFTIICLVKRRKRLSQKRYFTERKASVRRSRLLEAKNKGAESFVTTTTEGSYGVGTIPSIMVSDEDGCASGGTIGMADGGGVRKGEMLERIEEVDREDRISVEAMRDRVSVEKERESRIRVLAGEEEKEGGGGMGGAIEMNEWPMTRVEHGKPYT